MPAPPKPSCFASSFPVSSMDLHSGLLSPQPCALLTPCRHRLLSAYQRQGFNNSQLLLTVPEAGGQRPGGQQAWYLVRAHVHICRRPPCCVLTGHRALVPFSSNKGTNPIMGAPLMTSANPNSPPPNIVTLGVRASKMNFGETIIPSMASIIKA